MGDAASLTTVRAGALDFRAVTFGSDEYRLTCELRNEVLRKPLGLDLFSEDLNLEKDQLHFGMFDREAGLIACVIAVRVASGTAKIRQMAVRNGYVGQGVGRALMAAVEDRMALDGARNLLLHARITAAGFYEKLGYIRTGAPFVEVGVPHIRMEKSL